MSKTAPPPIVAEAIAANHYFVSNAPFNDKASAYIRDRCKRFHGMLIRDVLKAKYKHGKRMRNYPPSGLAYDLRCMWATTSTDPPPAYHLVPVPVAAILHAVPHSHHDHAADDAVTPVADISAFCESAPPPTAPTAAPTLSPSAMAAGLSTLDPTIFGRLSTDDRIAISQFHHHHRKPRFAA